MRVKQKKLIGLMVATAVALGSLGGCGKTEMQDDGELSVYHLSTDDKIADYILAFKDAYPDINVKVREFDDTAQMDEIVTNELNAGKGPDVVIFNSANNLDVMRLAEAGAFACLDERMKADESLVPEDYLPGAFEAGKVDGKQYILPLTFKVPVLYYNETPELGLEAGPVISYDQFSDALDTNIMKFSDDNTHGAITYTSLFPPLMVAGDAVRLTDGDRKVEYDDEKLGQMVSVMKKMYQQLEKITTIFQSYGGDTIDTVGRYELLLDCPVDLFNFTWGLNNFYQNTGIENFRVSALSQENNLEVCAMLSSFGAVTKNADREAYDFLRIAMDANPISNKSKRCGLSLNKTALQEQLEQHKEKTSTLQTKKGTFRMDGMPENVIEDLNTILDSVTEVTILNSRMMDILADTFDPYLNDEKSYEDCLTEFKQKMNLYTTE